MSILLIFFSVIILIVGLTRLIYNIIILLIDHQRLEQTLEYYADDKNYGCKECLSTEKIAVFYPVLKDRGEKARETIKKLKVK